MGDEVIHRGLRRRTEVLLDVDATDRLAERALGDGDPALPARAQLGRSGERLSVEVEVGVHDLAVQVGRGGADDLPAQPVPPGGDPVLDEQLGETGDEARLTHDDLIEGARGHIEGLEPGADERRGGAGQSRHLVPRSEVVGRLAVARADVVPVVGGDRPLELEDARGAHGRVVEAGHRQHPLEVREVGGADLGELVLAVVRLVGKAEAALLEKYQVALGVPGVVVDEGLNEAADSGPLQPPENLREAHQVGGRRRRGQLLGDRTPAQLFNPLLVHEAGIEVADLALLRARGRRLRGLDDRAHGLFGLLGQHVEGAVARLVGRDLGAIDPLPVDVPEEVVLRADRRIELVDFDAGGEQCVGHTRQPRFFSVHECRALAG